MPAQRDNIICVFQWIKVKGCNVIFEQRSLLHILVFYIVAMKPNLF